MHIDGQFALNFELVQRRYAERECNCLHGRRVLREERCLSTEVLRYRGDTLGSSSLSVYQVLIRLRELPNPQVNVRVLP